MNQNLSVEECKALYFDELALLESPRTVYRLNGHSQGRYYYTLDSEDEPTFYISVTNKIKKGMPTSPYLIKWISDMGYDKAMEYSNMRADYGTWMHTLFTELLINRDVDLGYTLKERTQGYLQERRQPLTLLDDWLAELKKDILAYGQFIKDHNVLPLMIEVVLASDKNKDAGAIDLFCEMNIDVDGLDYDNPYKSGARKGQPREIKEAKRVKAIVDYKSGKNGFYEDHEVQLKSYESLLRESFEEFKSQDIRLFNFAPNDWKKKPSYKLKDQTDSVSAEKLPHINAIGQIELKKMKNQALIIDGVLSLDNDPESCYKYVSLYDAVKQNEFES